MAARDPRECESRGVAFVFPHERLEVYALAAELAAEAHRLADRIPRGHRWLADQLDRAGGAPMLLIAEGADRWGRGEKHQRFSEASGECGEAVAAVQRAVCFRFATEAEFVAFRGLAVRVAAMLARLTSRFR